MRSAGKNGAAAETGSARARAIEIAAPQGRVVLLHNKASGRGEAGRVMHQVVDAVRAAGVVVDAIPVGPGTDIRTIQHALAGASAMIVAGGDGTLHHALPAAISAGVPVYQLPFGTENLFAREFGMCQSADRLARSIVRRTLATVDVATCNGRPFVLMCSVGFDANIVERVAAARTGPITRMNYVGQSVREAFSPRIPTLTIRVDGEELVTSAPGMVVIANSRQYAARLDPAPNADMTDGRLDVVFFPHSSSLSLGLWGVLAMVRAHTLTRDLVTARGSRITVHADSPSPFQLDGEHAGHIHPQVTDSRELALEIQPAGLRVLVPCAA